MAWMPQNDWTSKNGTSKTLGCAMRTINFTCFVAACFGAHGAPYNL